MNMILEMQMHATFILKSSKCRLCMRQCNVMENCTMFMTFFPIFVILFWFDSLCFFLFMENKDWLSLSERHDNSWDLILSFANFFRDFLRVYVLFDVATWQFWNDSNGAIWKFNQSTEILILGLVPFFI